MAIHHSSGITPPPPPGSPPLPQTKVTIVGKKRKLAIGKIWLGHSWYTNSWVPDQPPPPPRLLSSNTSLDSGALRGFAQRPQQATSGHRFRIAGDMLSVSVSDATPFVSCSTWAGGSLDRDH